MAFAKPTGGENEWDGIHMNGPSEHFLESIGASDGSQGPDTVEYSHVGVDGKIEVVTQKIKRKKAEKKRALEDFDQETARLWQVIQDYQDKKGVLGEEIRNALVDAHDLQLQNDKLSDKQTRRNRKRKVTVAHRCRQ